MRRVVNQEVAVSTNHDSDRIVESFRTATAPRTTPNISSSSSCLRRLGRCLGLG